MNWFKPKSGPLLKPKRALTGSGPLTPRVRQFCARVWSFLNKPRGPFWSEEAEQNLIKGKITFRKWRYDDPRTFMNTLLEALWIPKIEIEIPPEPDEEEEEETELDEKALAMASEWAKDPVAVKKFVESHPPGYMVERLIQFELDRNVQQMIAHQEAVAAAIERGKNENGTGWKH